MDMYRQDGRENGMGAVKLTRVSPHDSRTFQNLKRKRSERRRKRIANLLLLFAVFFTLGVGAVHLALRFTAEEVPQTEIVRDDFTKRKERQTAREPQEDIVVLGDELHAPRVAIDPGHGGMDGGCEQGDVLEKKINLEISLLLARKLNDMGYETVLIREDNDTQLTLEERVKKAGEAEADLYISIHQNFYDGKQAASVSGVETWYCGTCEGSRRLAQLVHKGAVEKTGAKDRNIKETEELYVIREAAMPACLIEAGFLSCPEECGLLVSSEYQDKLAEGIAQGIDLYFNPKTMYLTFDDGPSAENTAKVLDILKEHDIKATFFLVGENVEKRPEMARRIVEEGHTIGIHCYSHDYQTIYKSVDAYLDDFQKAYDVILETTGVEVQIFRFPGGSVNSNNQAIYMDLIDAMTEKGYIYFDWNASLDDAMTRTTPAQLVQNGVSSTRGRSRIIMLCHDIVYNTTQCLEDLIDSLPEYRMEPLTSEVQPIRFRLP